MSHRFDDETMRSMGDGCEEWRDVYIAGGEDLLRIFSEIHHKPERGLGTTLEESFVQRLTSCLADVPMSETDMFKLIFRLPESSRCDAAYNRCATERVIESIWVGEYYNGIGVRDPYAVSSIAFFYNHEIAYSIYMRRPDLRHAVAPCMVRMYEAMLRGRGLIPMGNDSFKDGVKN